MTAASNAATSSSPLSVSRLSSSVECHMPPPSSTIGTSALPVMSPPRITTSAL
jgi:hypothetical protein